MKKFDFNNNPNVFFVGIGGISMSGLAKISQFLGANVSGSDIKDNDEIQTLYSLGIKVFIGHNAKNISKDLDLIVYSGAIHNDNIELITARKLGIRIIERSKFLGMISRMYENVIAISGTHGKTTTTSMISWCLKCAGLNPTVHIGGESVNFGTNTFIGDNKYLVVEACEYRESFKYLKPSIALVTNIECDHMDYYRDYQDIYNAFSKFARSSKFLISSEKLQLRARNKCIIDREYQIVSCKFEENGYNFRVLKHNSYFGDFRLNMIGEHNVENALFAIATADYMGIDRETIFQSLLTFRGVKRRYENIGKIWDIPVIIDYAHHPTEISKSLGGLKSVYKNILVIFQPHTYSRTIKLFGDFIFALEKEDRLVLYATYPAREAEIRGGRAEDLAEVLSCPCINNLEDLQEFIRGEIDFIDCIAVLGAGDLAEKIKTILTIKNF